MLTKIKKNDGVDIIAPGSNVCDGALQAGIQVLKKWGLKTHVDRNIFGPDLLYTNSNNERYRCLDQALDNPDSSMIWCLRGGSGSTRLIPYLEKKIPTPQKIFIGFSDITALHLHFYQNWGWQTCIHGPVLKQIGLKTIDAHSIADLKNFLFHRKKPAPFKLQALNDHLSPLITGPLHGGNLSLIQSSLGTSWHIKAQGHILILEDVNEQPYRTAERLEQLRQAKVLADIKALVFSDFNFLEPDRDTHDALNNKVLQQFASEVDFPVFKTQGIGHTFTNRAFQLGGQAHIKVQDNHYILHQL